MSVYSEAPELLKQYKFRFFYNLNQYSEKCFKNQTYTFKYFLTFKNITYVSMKFESNLE